VREEFETGRVRFSLARWERVRVRDDSIEACLLSPRPSGEGQGEGRIRRGTCPLFPRPLGEGQGEGRIRRGTSSVFSLAHWERARVREGFDTGHVRFSPRPLGEGQGEGRIRNGTYAPRTSACFARTPSPMDVLSSIVIKKGRFGTDPYNIFYEHGTSRKPSVFSLARWERVRVRKEFGAGRTHLVPRRASQGRRPLRMFFRAWL